jgi:TolB-like protein/Flp pilus assembly protein TadD
MFRSEDLQQPSAGAVRAELARIAASPGFAKAERMRRFIDFVVDETLQGRADALKEYPIGVEVFGRADFDPRSDTIVRVEARRLRKKLDEYYAREGRLDVVRIILPSGSYVPVFETLSEEGNAPRRPRGILGALGVSIALAAALGAYYLFWQHARPVAAPQIASIAVLPFLDLSPGKDQDYVCDGLSEELINALSAVPNLKVAARTSSFRYKGKADDVRRIGADLGVEHILEGSIRTSGKRLRVTAQLIRVNDGSHIWSREFDRDFDHIFAVQEELARAVATSIGAELGTGIAVVRTVNIEAYRLYLQGRQYWRQFEQSSTASAISFFEQAIASDPTFAAAYAGLGDSYWQMSFYGRSAPVYIEKARQAATTALKLAPNSAEAETTLGQMSAFYDWDWKACERHYRRAIQDDPNYINAHWLFATTCLAPEGRLDEALEEARRAALLDPLSPLTHTMVGAVHWYRKEFDAALKELDQAIALSPAYSQASLFKTFVYLSQGHVDLAAGFRGPTEWRVYIQAKLGDTVGARKEIEGRADESRDPIGIAGGYAGLGEPDKALDWLEKAADSKVPRMIWIHFQAPFDSLHTTARYRAIRTRMHLP